MKVSVKGCVRPNLALCSLRVSSLRWLARRSLFALEEEHPVGLPLHFDDWDHMDASAANRGKMVDALREALRLGAPGRLHTPDPARLMKSDFTEDTAMRNLCGHQSSHVISIGE